MTKRTANYYHPIEYRAWKHMLNRCLNPKCAIWKHYGGRGITVCQEWQDGFDGFYKELGDRPSSRHSVDRIDNSRGYEPGNVKWSTPEEQNRNRRSWEAQPKLAPLTIGGVTRSYPEWDAHIGNPKGTTRSRVKGGLSEAAILYKGKLNRYLGL